MKKKFILFMLLFFMAGFVRVNAECNNKELVKWSKSVYIVQTDYVDKGLILDKNGFYKRMDYLGYSYILSLSNPRDDVLIKAVDSSGNEYSQEFFEGYDLNGIGCYNNLDDIEYTLIIYGSKDSACPGEVITRINYDVDQYNRYYKTRYCEEYPEFELCKIYKDTASISENEFTEQIETYIEEVNKKNTTFYKILGYIKKYYAYVLFAILPFLLVSLTYKYKINDYLKKHGEI